MSVRYSSEQSGDFGWFEQAPAHWTVTRLKRVVAAVSTKRQVEAEDRYIGLENIEPWTGRLVETPEGSAAEGVGAIFREGDVLFGKLRPYLAKAHVARYEGIGSSELLVLRGRRLRPEYLRYCLTAPSFVDAVTATTYGAKMPRASWDDIGALFVPTPPLEEQTVIVDFLDRETARIDALVAKQDAFLVMLDEHRRALIAEVTTKGLGAASSKRTGVEVYPTLPAHWSVKRLKQLIRPGTSISYGIVQPGTHQPDGVPFVQTADLTKRRFDPAVLQRTEPSVAEMYPRSRIRTNDVILGIRASVGDAALVPEALDGVNLSRGIARIVPGPLISGAFLVLALETPQSAWFWSLNMQGSTFREVSIETVRELPVPVPPLAEQAAVLAYLNIHLARHEVLCTSAAEMIERLREHRSALITAAVTGGLHAAERVAAEAA